MLKKVRSSFSGKKKKEEESKSPVNKERSISKEVVEVEFDDHHIRRTHSGTHSQHRKESINQKQSALDKIIQESKDDADIEAEKIDKAKNRK